MRDKSLPSNSLNIKDESRIWDILQLPLLHLVHRLVCSCSAPKSSVIGDSTDKLSELGDVPFAATSEEACSGDFESSSAVSWDFWRLKLFDVSVLSCWRTKRAQLYSTKTWWVWQSTNRYIAVNVLTDASLISEYFRLISGCVSDKSKPIADASGSVRKALKKFAGWTVSGWPFCTWLLPTSNIWNRKDSSHARQNSLLQRCFLSVWRTSGR